MSLMPSSSSELSRILDDVYAARLAAIEMPIRNLGDPWKCPLPLLPYLAWALSVDQWDDAWPENIKRQRCADAMREHRIKGSVESVESAIAGFGATAQIKEWWEQSPKGAPGTCDIWMVCQQNNRMVSALQLQGEQWIFSARPVPMQPNRRYKIRLVVRQASDEPGTIYAGVATLGNQYQSIVGGAGSHRYCGGTAQTVNSTDGWQVFEGIISGIGDDHNSFRPGTVYVRPMFIVNYKGKGTAHVAELSMWDMLENRQLVKNNDFSLGKAGWSHHYAGESVPENTRGIITTDHMGLTADIQNDVKRAAESTKPTHIHFQIKAGVAAQASLNISGMARLLNFHRLEMTAQ